MRKTACMAAFMVAALATGNLAWAEGNGHGKDGSQRHHAQRDHHNDRDKRHGDRHDKHRIQDHRDPGFAQSRGAGPEHNFRRGGHLPQEYRHRHYVVDDWRGHHLSAPPRGYHWVQTGGDYVLIAITTGIIAQILIGSY